MPRRKGEFSAGCYYHIFNRVLEHETLFPTPANYLHCLKLVKNSLHRYESSLLAYCLMPNHYHFLLKQLSDKPLSQFIGSIFNPYVQSLNVQKGRKGPLFEGRFKHVLVDKEEYLVHLCRYIHCNPVIANLVKRPEDWPYSNYLEWIGKRDGMLQDEEFIRDHFVSRSDYLDFVTDDFVEDEIKANLGEYTVE